MKGKGICPWRVESDDLRAAKIHVARKLSLSQVRETRIRTETALQQKTV